MFELESGSDIVNLDKFHQVRGHNSLVPQAIRLVIELGRDTMPISIVIRFGDDWIMIVQVRERTD